MIRARRGLEVDDVWPIRRAGDKRNCRIKGGQATTRRRGDDQIYGRPIHCRKAYGVREKLKRGPIDKSYLDVDPKGINGRAHVDTN